MKWFVLGITFLMTGLNPASHTCCAHPLTERVDVTFDTSQHERLRDLLSAHLAITQHEQTELIRLQSDYGGVDFTNIYQTQDLSTGAGILKTQQRRLRFLQMVDAFEAMETKKWSDWEAALNDDHLDEPLASTLMATFAKAKPSILEEYAGWFAAMRKDADTVLQLLVLARSQMGTLRYFSGRLISDDLKTAVKINDAYKAIHAAESKVDIARHIVLEIKDPVIPIIYAALQPIATTT